MDEINEIILILENLEAELPSKTKTELNTIICKLKHEFNETDISSIQEKIEEISELDIDQFSRNELLNISSILENYNC